jgi:hypothetical protein
MPTSVALGRFVGPAIHAHGRGQVGIHGGAFDTQLVIPVHVHDVTVVSLMSSGVATERVEEGTREISAQDLIVTPAYAAHSYRLRQPGRWLNMQLSDAWIARATDGHALLYDERSEIVHSGWPQRGRCASARRSITLTRPPRGSQARSRFVQKQPLRSSAGLQAGIS